MSDWITAHLPADAAAIFSGLFVSVPVAAALLAVMWAARALARRRYRIMARTAETEVLEVPAHVVGRTTWLFMIVVSVCAGLAVEGTSDRIGHVLGKVLTITVIWQAGVWVSTAVAAWLDHRRKATMEADKAAAGSIGVIRFVARVTVWAMVILLTLENLGFDITALVAGLGIGGVAVALAVQNVLGDLLASLSIALDQPFLIGDFLVVGEHMGTVEYIGIKSTRIRSLSGEQIVMSNSDLLNGRLRNYGRMQERRVVFSVGVTYETPKERLHDVVGVLRTVLKTQDGVRFDRAHFSSFGPYSLDFECVYYVLSADYTRYMDIQQEINFRIHAEFDALGVQFAYPTQTVWMGQPAAPAAGGTPPG